MYDKVITSLRIARQMRYEVCNKTRMKIQQGKRCNASALFNAVIAAQLEKCIANYSMDQYVLDIALSVENKYGQNSLRFNILKSSECLRMITDNGYGFPDPHWKETVWHKFIADVYKSFEICFTISENRYLNKLNPEKIQKNCLNN